MTAAYLTVPGIPTAEEILQIASCRPLRRGDLVAHLVVIGRTVDVAEYSHWHLTKRRVVEPGEGECLRGIGGAGIVVHYCGRIGINFGDDDEPRFGADDDACGVTFAVADRFTIYQA